MSQLNPLLLARGVDTIVDYTTISSASDYVLPSSVRKGQAYMITNEVTNNAVLTIKASDTTTIDTIRGGYCYLIAKQANPTTSTHWKVIDVYEDALWTPILSAVSGTVPTGVTYSTQVGRYVRKGEWVTLSLELGWTAITAGTGTATIAGIPYNTTATQTYVGSVQTNSIDWASTNKLPALYAANSDSVLRITLFDDAQAQVFMDTAAYGSGSFSVKRIYGTVTYKRA